MKSMKTNVPKLIIRISFTRVVNSVGKYQYQNI